MGFALCLLVALVPFSCSAEGLRPLNIGVRARFSQTEVLGRNTTEEFHAYDVSVTFALPWDWQSQSGWEPSTRLMASAGALNGAQKTALVVSLIPLVAMQRRQVTVDLGAGAALLSRHHFGSQDYGGAFQFAITAGIGVLLSEHLGLGYRFLHYSDAGMYGSNRTGADLHTLELTYNF